MKSRATVILIIFLLILGAVGAGWVYYQANPEAWEDFTAEMRGESTGSEPAAPRRQTPSQDGALLATGAIEAETITLASELGGRVVQLLVSEGEAVTAGTPLAIFDDRPLAAQRDGAAANVAQARAALEAAEAQLALAKAGASDEEIAAVESSVQAAEGSLAAAEAILTQAEIGLREAKEAGAPEGTIDLAEAAVDQAQGGVDMAAAALNGARAELDRARAGARPEEIDVLEAQVAGAEAAVSGAEAGLRLLEIQLEQMTLSAPSDGVVVERLIQAGELALPGAPLFTLANLNEVTLTVYVPEAELGRVAPGLPVDVTVDAYDLVFPGLVSHIATEAEFTPRNVQTQEERVHMVFAVTLRLDNPDRLLKPGMPADALFAES